MRYASVCSGVEAAGLAWKSLGWEAKFYAEVEPFPSAVLQQKFGATRPLRPLKVEEAADEKDRLTRRIWARQIAELPMTDGIPNLGDFTKIQKGDYDGEIDLLVGGTPCQSYSIAGLRKGLSDPRGNLALEFVRLAYRTNARWVVWENVPGVLSSGNGRDFASFLSLLCGWEVRVPEGGWGRAGIITPAPGCFGLAWRMLDTQYTRVPMFPRAIPQRRRRLFVVGYRSESFGDSSDWQNPAKVLLDGEVRERDSPPSRTAWESPSASADEGTACPDESVTRRKRMKSSTGNELDLVRVSDENTWMPGGEKVDAFGCTTHNSHMPDTPRILCVIDMRQIESQDEGVSPTLIATDFKGGKAVCYENHGQDSRVSETETSPTITGRSGTGGNNLPFVQLYDDSGFAGYSENNGVSGTLRASGGSAGGGSEMFVQKIYPICLNPAMRNSDGECRAGIGIGHENAPSVTVRTTPAPCVSIAANIIGRQVENGGNGLGAKENVAYTLDTVDVQAVACHSVVRKLLPVETERLMGFPDNHTRICWRGKPEKECPDAPRYKACGNSMCVNVMNWIGQRINSVEEEINGGRQGN